MRRRSLLKAVGLLPLATILPISVNGNQISEEGVVSSPVSEEIQGEIETEFKTCEPDKDKTFKNYYALENSDAAFKLAKQVVARPGLPALNPFLIYGPDGMGKDHLANAIGNALNKKFEVHSEAMSGVDPETRKYGYYKYDQLRAAIDFHLSKFDVLILNIWAKSKKPDPKEQALYAELITELIKCGKQVVVTFDGNLAKINKLEPKFKNVIMSGSLVEIKSPTLDQKKKIASRFAELNQISLSPEQIDILGRKWASFGELEDKVIEADDVLKFWNV